MVMVGWEVRARRFGAAALLLLVLICPGLARGGGPESRSPWGGGPLSLESAAGMCRQPAPTPAPTSTYLRRQRKNTVSLGAQGQYGIVAGSSEIADGFDHGAGYAVRVRYMLSPRTALGFSFENQRFGSIREPLAFTAVGDSPDSHVVIITVAVEGVLFFHREREITPYLLGGFGFATPDEIGDRLVGGNEPGPRRVNEGPFLVVGGGIERFIRPRFSIDTSLRGFAQIGNSELTTVAELAFGIHLYPGD